MRRYGTLPLAALRAKGEAATACDQDIDLAHRHAQSLPPFRGAMRRYGTLPLAALRAKGEAATACDQDIDLAHHHARNPVVMIF
jgi:hypothetical protein